MKNLILAIMLSASLFSCSNAVKPTSHSAPKNTCEIKRNAYKLHVIKKTKYKKIIYIKGKKYEQEITIEEFKKLVTKDFQMLVIDKVNLINDNETLKLEIACLRKFI